MSDSELEALKAWAKAQVTAAVTRSLSAVPETPVAEVWNVIETTGPDQHRYQLIVRWQGKSLDWYKASDYFAKIKDIQNWRHPFQADKGGVATEYTGGRQGVSLHVSLYRSQEQSNEQAQPGEASPQESHQEDRGRKGKRKPGRKAKSA